MSEWFFLIKFIKRETPIFYRTSPVAASVNIVLITPNFNFTPNNLRKKLVDVSCFTNSKVPVFPYFLLVSANFFSFLNNLKKIHPV